MTDSSVETPCLEHPCGALLVEESPEEDEGTEDDGDVEKAADRVDHLLGVFWSSVVQPMGDWLVARGTSNHFSQRSGYHRDDLAAHVLLARWILAILRPSQQKEYQSQQHENSRDTKGQWEAVLVSEALNTSTEDWGDDDGEEGTSVDGKVEEGEELGAQVFLVFGELISSKRRNTRLDASGGEGNHKEARKIQRRSDRVGEEGNGTH